SRHQFYYGRTEDTGVLIVVFKFFGQGIAFIINVFGEVLFGSNQSLHQLKTSTRQMLERNILFFFQNRNAVSIDSKVISDVKGVNTVVFNLFKDFPIFLNLIGLFDKDRSIEYTQFMVFVEKYGRVETVK